MIDDGLSSRRSAGELPGSDDGSASVLHGGDELSVDPGIIGNSSTHGSLVTTS